MQFYASNNPGCGMYAVGEAFETNYLAIGFPNDMPAALVQAVSSSIVRLQVRLLLRNMLCDTISTTKHMLLLCVAPSIFF
jgi:hypothetical protein